MTLVERFADISARTYSTTIQIISLHITGGFRLRVHWLYMTKAHDDLEGRRRSVLIFANRIYTLALALTLLESLRSKIPINWTDAALNPKKLGLHDVPFCTWSFLSPPYDSWITATMPENQERLGCSQRVHFNITEGHVLVNGKPRSNLPLEIRNSPVVKEMFGNQHLLIYPSSLPGMTNRSASYFCNASNCSATRC